MVRLDLLVQGQREGPPGGRKDPLLGSLRKCLPARTPCRELCEREGNLARWHGARPRGLHENYRLLSWPSECKSAWERLVPWQRGGLPRIDERNRVLSQGLRGNGVAKSVPRLPSILQSNLVLTCLKGVYRCLWFS